MDLISFSEIQTSSLEIINNSVLTLDFLFQISITLIGFGFGFFVRRLTRPKLLDIINQFKIPYRFAQTLRNLTKLTFQTTALVIIFTGAKILEIEALGFETGLLEAITKLLGAWIIIRTLAQMIENQFARNIVATTIWAIAALSIFGILEETTAALDAVGLDLGEFRLSALTVIKGLIALFILLYIATFISKIVERRISRVTSLTPSSRVLITKISRVFLVVCALLIGITTAGIDLSLLAVFSGAVGLGVGFGLQKGISNLFSGMLLLVDQSIKPGDVIELDGPSGTFGWVSHMGARYTEITNRDNKSYLIPNEDFITQRVINWSHGDTLVRIETKFGVHYDSDPHLVKKIAQEAASRPDRVVEDPAPVCHLVEFGDSSLNFVLRYWIKDAEKGVTNTKGSVMLALWDAFKEHEINIPYPHREVFIHEQTKPAPRKKAAS